MQKCIISVKMKSIECANWELIIMNRRIVSEVIESI